MTSRRIPISEGNRYLKDIVEIIITEMEIPYLPFLEIRVPDFEKSRKIIDTFLLMITKILKTPV